MSYFGTPRAAPAWRHMSVVTAPVGDACTWCSEAIAEDDDGVVNDAGQVYHADCWVRQVSGGANHLRGTCTCRGGSDPADPPDKTLRESASEAVRLFEEGHL